MPSPSSAPSPPTTQTSSPPTLSSLTTPPAATCPTPSSSAKSAPPLSLLRSLSLSARHSSTTTFVLSPNFVHVPVVYFSLLSLGVTVSPTNPLGSDSKIAHQILITQPDFAFATSATAGKLPKALRTILLNSSEFLSMLKNNDEESNDVVSQWPEVREEGVGGGASRNLTSNRRQGGGTRGR